MPYHMRSNRPPPFEMCVCVWGCGGDGIGMGEIHVLD